VCVCVCVCVVNPSKTAGNTQLMTHCSYIAQMQESRVSYYPVLLSWDYCLGSLLEMAQYMHNVHHAGISQ